jgi:hypothetical protein
MLDLKRREFIMPTYRQELVFLRSPCPRRGGVALSRLARA